jgi:hypothetical protein
MTLKYATVFASYDKSVKVIFVITDVHNVLLTASWLTICIFCVVLLYPIGNGASTQL